MSEKQIDKDRHIFRWFVLNLAALFIISVVGVSVYVYYAFFGGKAAVEHRIAFNRWKSYSIWKENIEKEPPTMKEGASINLSYLIVEKWSKYGEYIADKYYSDVWRAENWFSDTQTLALCEAMRRRDISEIERLIAGGCDVNAIGRDGMRLLFWGLLLGAEIQEVLLRNGADPNFIIESDYDVDLSGIVFSDGKRMVGHSYLFFVQFFAGVSRVMFFNDVVSVLLKYGADPNYGGSCVLVLFPRHRNMYGGGPRDGDAIGLDYGADNRRLIISRHSL